MTIRVSTSVMAHPRREALATKLAVALGDGTRIVWDRQNDEWDTGRRAWETYDPAAGWHCVIQDDAVVCDDLAAGLARALEHVPAEAVVSLYTGTQRPDAQKVTKAVAQAEKANAAWIVMPEIKWGVGLAVPTAAIPEMLTRSERNDSVLYDAKLSAFFLNVAAWPVWCTWPSLVDHRDNVTPLVRKTMPIEGPRVAHRFLGVHASALEIDWGAGSVQHDDMGRLTSRQRRLAAT